MMSRGIWQMLFFGKYFWTLSDHHLGSEGIVISVLECSHVGLYWGQTEGWREQERGLWIRFLIPVYDLGNLTFLVWACSVSCKVREWFLKSPLVLLRPMNLSFFIECTYIWDAVIVHRMFNGRQFTCQCRRCGFSSSVRKIPWRRNGNSVQYSCWGNPMDSRLVGYGPWGRRVVHNLVTKQQQKASLHIKLHRKLQLLDLFSLFISSWCQPLLHLIHKPNCPANSLSVVCGL